MEIPLSLYLDHIAFLSADFFKKLRSRTTVQYCR